MIKAGDTVEFVRPGEMPTDAKVSVVWNDGSIGPAVDLILATGELVYSVAHASKVGAGTPRWDATS